MALWVVGRGWQVGGWMVAGMGSRPPTPYPQPTTRHPPCKRGRSIGKRSPTERPEKSASRTASPLLEGGGGLAELRVGIRADGLNGRQADDDDQGEHDGILNRGGTVFRLQELLQARREFLAGCLSRDALLSDQPASRPENRQPGTTAANDTQA